MDQREAAALKRILEGCEITKIELMACQAAPVSAGGTGEDAGDRDDVLARYDDNRNGRITCKESRRHGMAPVHRSHPACRYMRDGDGVVCK